MKNQKNTKTVCVMCTLVLVYLGWPLKQSFLNFVSKSILRAPPILEKKNAKNPQAKKATSQKSKQKKQHLCHHCGVADHTWPNCYKWLATQQSNDMIASGSQNQLQSSLVPLGDLLKALISFRTWTISILPPHHRFKGLIKGKVLLGCERKRTPSNSIIFFYLFVFLFYITCVFCFYFESV